MRDAFASSVVTITLIAAVQAAMPRRRHYMLLMIERMTRTIAFARAAGPLHAATSRAAYRTDDDKAMLRAAAELTRDLFAPNPRIYWSDLVASALLGYGATAAVVLLTPVWAAMAAGIVAVFALYRALLFIHEVSHMKHSAVPGFRAGWNALVGVPLLTPSFMYEGVHNLHHARTRYGTADDPEYLPLASMKPWTLPLFILVSALAPVGLLIRFAILSPLSLLSARLRRMVVERFSALSINPDFRRRMPEGEALRQFDRLDIAASGWALTVVALVATGVVPLRAFLIVLTIVAAVAVLNQMRTLVAHLWENEDGEAMTVTAQYLDSVNVPPPALLPGLWAPVGLRYHALHHLLPSLPYHALGEAHRRIGGTLAATSPYHEASYSGLPWLVRYLVGNTMRPR